MCNMCEERIIVGDEEYCLAGRDCSKRLSFVDKCKNEIVYAKEEIDYFTNNKNAKTIWTAKERDDKVVFWTNEYDFWVDLLNKHYEGDT